jgi:hypothetical protein
MTDLDKACRTSESFHKHARGCKKSPEDCDTCKASIAYHASLPLETLAKVLEDQAERLA